LDKEIVVNMCTGFRPNWKKFRKKKPNLMLRLNYSTAFTESISSKQKYRVTLHGNSYFIMNFPHIGAGI